MKVIADTNLILRVLTRDDEQQFAIAVRVFSEAKVVVYSIVALCETAWFLRNSLKWDRADVARAFRLLLDDPRAMTDHDLVQTGLAMLDAGGDFADAVIAADGRRHTDGVFATFDNQAARLLSAQGVAVAPMG